MLLYYSISNFKSFKERADFNMIASKDEPLNDGHVYTGFPVNLLRTSAIYGYNAAGKSNFFDSLHVLRMLVIGTKRLRSEDDYMFYKLDEESSLKPTTFEIEFFIGKSRYCYSLSIIKLSIVEEWLAKINPDKTVSYLFKRELVEDKTSLTVEGYITNPKEQMRMEIYAEELDKKRDVPFLHYGSARGVESLREAYSWFTDKLEVVKPNAHFMGDVSFFSDEKTRALANQMISFFQLGIEEIKVKIISLEDLFVGEKEIYESIKSKFESSTVPIKLNKKDVEYTVFKNDLGEFVAGKIVTIHKGNVEFDLSEESMGTRMLFELIPGFVSSIVSGKVYFFDELECNKHPEMTKELLILYQVAGENHEGQIVFTTHECNLLDNSLLRKDEIWFSERDDDGVSHLFALTDFKPEYKKEDLKTGYLSGRFSKIPFFQDPKNLKWYDNSEVNKN